MWWIVPIAVTTLVSTSTRTHGRPRYQALSGGRPLSAVPLDAATTVARLVHSAAATSDGTHRSSRLWLDLSNGESLVVAFEPLSEQQHCVLMSVQQTRLTDACDLDDDSCRASCVGCVAVRWDLRSHEGVLLDLFKAKAGERTGCDLSSADDEGVQWGRLMLRVVDDLAQLLGIRHMLVADEAAVRLRVWGEAEPAHVPLRYLRPLLRGVGYYESSGFYAIPEAQWYWDERHSAEADYAPKSCATARRRAAESLSALNTVRAAPFRGGHLCRALESAAVAAAAHEEEARGRLWPPPPEPRATLLHRFARAVALAQEAPPASRVAAFARTCARQDEAARGEALPNRFGVHASSRVPYEPSLGSFARRHEAAIDAELLGAPSLGAMVQLLHARNRAADDDEDDARVEMGLRAGALLLALVYDFYALWRPRRSRRFVRKDYFGGSAANKVAAATAVLVPPDALECSAPVAVGRASHVPIIRESFYLCPGADDEACELPWGI